MPTLVRRKVDKASTMIAYTNRLLSLRQEYFEPLQGCWLSSYEIWDSFSKEQLLECELELRRFTELDNNALVLFQVCMLRGIDVLGVTSERLIGGKHIASLPVEGGREKCVIVYVGEHNAFCDKKRHASFSVLTEDKRYMPK